VGYQRGDYHDKWRIERLAAKIRRQAGLDQFEVLDPSVLVKRVGAELFLLSDLIDDDAALARARQIGFDGAASAHPETGELLILLNCGKPPRRRLATLMEELGHLLLKHEPCRIERDPAFGLAQRSFDRSQENEAYDLGAALLLPKERIQRDVKEREALIDDIADAHGCSQDLVTYRVRRLRLWNRYTSYALAKA
jgi:Zn-dependent peptidase ImmA (M78 family)